ncbi:unnamed protein product [Allacma fusca]|uniref:Damage-specific DNA-binding protein 2 n=1 Tax=Allacma fusca TaxID=39272 RepID=A0A8J2KJJ7_9HEXA|nr:unnamed protein product [Allacma fusca]
MAPVNYGSVSIGRNVCHFNDVSWGLSEGKALSQLNTARLVLMRHNFTKSLGQFQSQELAKLERRVTALGWHPKVPYLVSAACKGGSIVLGRGQKGLEEEIQFTPVVLSEGTGPGGAIFSLKFDENCPNGLYTAGLSGVVQRLNIANPNNTITYDNTDDWNIWYTGMDVNFSNNILAAGNNKGVVKLFDVRTKTTIQKLRLHKSKIHHCEFNRRDSNLLATGALDERNAVCLWDLRNLKNADTDVQAVKYFDDFKGANIASFNMDGSRLLVNDQKDQIKVYQGPVWTDVLTINHPHRQFQHLTAIEASWHPFDDIIIIGRYPKAENPKAKPAPPRPIEFFDGQSGELLYSLYHPANGIVSLNALNPMADVLASGMGSTVLLWQSTRRLEKLSESKKGRKGTTISTAMRSAIRGETGGRESGSEEDDVSKTKKALAAGKKTRSKASVGQKSKRAMAKLVLPKRRRLTSVQCRRNPQLETTRQKRRRERNI